MTEIEVDKSIRVQLREHGIKLTYTRRKYISVSIVTPAANSWAYIRGKGVYGEGLPYDITAADNMSGGTEVQWWAMQVMLIFIILLRLISMTIPI